MPAAALAQGLGISTPATVSTLPAPFFVNGNEISGRIDRKSYRLRDPGFGSPATLSFRVPDRAAAVSPWIAKNQRVYWWDQALARPLYAGFVKDIARVTVGPWLDLQITCTDLSDALDTAIPVTSWDSGKHGINDRAMIQALLGYFAQEPNLGAGGFVQLISSGMPPSIPSDRTTLRNAIDQVLQATGVQGASSYVDYSGRLHTMVVGDIAAPYTISDAPNYTTSVPAGISVVEQGADDVDAIMVYGGTPAGSGPVYGYRTFGFTPRSPLRWGTLDAPHATTAAARDAAAKVEFYRRQNQTTVTLVVTGFDGWAKGQLLTITNGPLGWAGKQLTITALDMDVLSGTGIRRYRITAGSDPVLQTSRLASGVGRHAYGPVLGSRITGSIGGITQP